MLRKWFSIFVFLLLLISGSGLSYLCSTYFVRVQARRSEDTISSDVSVGNFITLHVTEFNKLPKRRISKTITEIVYHGDHYDIYGSKINSDSTITLHTIKDIAENNIQHIYQDRNLNSRSGIRFAPFYVFHFNVEKELELTVSDSFCKILYLTDSKIPTSNYIFPFSPPPEKLSA